VPVFDLVRSCENLRSGQSLKRSWKSLESYIQNCVATLDNTLFCAIPPAATPAHARSVTKAPRAMWTSTNVRRARVRMTGSASTSLTDTAASVRLEQAVRHKIKTHVRSLLRSFDFEIKRKQSQSYFRLCGKRLPCRLFAMWAASGFIPGSRCFIQSKVPKA